MKYLFFRMYAGVLVLFVAMWLQVLVSCDQLVLYAFPGYYTRMELNEISICVNGNVNYSVFTQPELIIT